MTTHQNPDEAGPSAEHDDVGAAVAGFARQFHAAATDAESGQLVASPLGAWLLAALAGEADGHRNAQSSQARRLLCDPHPAVAAALACWVDATARTDALDAWEAGLPAGAARGPIPSQSEADRWARDNTFGMIDRFPVHVTSDTLVVLANALASRIRWSEPFSAVPAAQLGTTCWDSRIVSGQLNKVLSSAPTHQVLVADTPVGLCGVHAGASDDGLLVVSVIADPSAQGRAGRAGILDAAVDVARMLAGKPSSSKSVSLWDLPETGHAWKIEECRSDVNTELGTATLPAWEASSTLDLTADRRFGVHDALGVLAGIISPQRDGLDIQARQSAVASYRRDGFEAAAVTAAMLCRGGFASATGRCRVARLCFARPYAVVACAQHPTDSPDGSDSPWHGVPVFSAWVDEPADAEAGTGTAVPQS